MVAGDGARPARDPGAMAAGRGRHVLPLDPDRSERPEADVRGDLGGGRLPDRRRRRDMGTAKQERRHGLRARTLRRGRPMRPQAPPPPSAARSALAAEPLRRLPLRRPRRRLGAPGGERASERVRLPAGTSSAGAGRRLRDPGRRRGESRHAGRAARRLSHRRRRRHLGAAPGRAAAAGVGRGHAGEASPPTGSTRPGSTSARRAARSSSRPHEGDEWLEVARQLPPILSVEVGEWS